MKPWVYSVIRGIMRNYTFFGTAKSSRKSIPKDIETKVFKKFTHKHKSFYEFNVQLECQNRIYSGRKLQSQNESSSHQIVQTKPLSMIAYL